MVRADLYVDQYVTTITQTVLFMNSSQLTIDRYTWIILLADRIMKQAGRIMTIVGSPYFMSHFLYLLDLVHLQSALSHRTAKACKNAKADPQTKSPP